MESRWRPPICFSIALMFLAGCTVKGPESAAGLEGTSWVLELMEAEKPIPGRTVTAQFMEGSIAGSSGCNSYGGSYQTDGQNLEIGELASTLMACVDPEGVMDQEQAFLASLRDARRYEVSEGQLRVTRSDRGLLVFVPQD